MTMPDLYKPLDSTSPLLSNSDDSFSNNRGLKFPIVEKLNVNIVSNNSNSAANLRERSACPQFLNHAQDREGEKGGILFLF